MNYFLLLFLKTISKKTAPGYKQFLFFFKILMHILNIFFPDKYCSFLGKTVKNMLGFILNNSLQWCDFATVANDGIMKEITTNFHITKSKVQVINNGVDIELFRSKCSKINHNFSMIYIGNFSKKDLFVPIVNVMDKLKNYLPLIKLVLVGDGRNKQNIETLFKFKQITHLVNFCGKVKHSEIPQYIDSADVGIILRDEGVVASIPVCIYEYMAMGVPVIVNNVGEMAKFVTDRNAGFVINDENELENLLIDLYYNRKYPDNLSIDMQKWVIKYYSRKKLSKKFGNIIYNLLKQ